MPFFVLSDAGLIRTYDKVEIDNLFWNYGAVSAGQVKRTIVSVATGDWNADTTGYKDATNLGNLTFYYADLTHSLGSEIARAIAGKDLDGFLMEETECQKNTNSTVLRIWLARQPGYTTKWLVIG